ncbi:MAG: cytochrome c biogenesis protein CcsA [Verrucomicrobiae bacterium]|nr:cytochrome c biogenesis protein CcsA [Verrucomicrobiae bacterium]NNJ87117.1 cytochrome c biogenesis protein CcsA [Akkermansiaceae bacterium]
MPCFPTKSILTSICSLLTLMLASSPLIAQSADSPATLDKQLSEDAGKVLANIPIQNAGRIKPFDSFARFTLLSCYHKSKINGQSASQWLAQLILDPDTAYDVKCFRIKNVDLIDDLGLKKSADGKHVYSFNELRTTIDAQRSRAQLIQERDKNHRTLVESQLLKLYNAVYNYFSISRSFTCLTPDLVIDNKKLADQLGLPHGEPFSFLQIHQRWDKFRSTVEKLKTSFDRNNAYDLAVFELVSRIKEKQQRDSAVAVFTVIPPDVDPIHTEWLTPWQALDFQTPLTSKQLHLVTELEATVTALANNNAEQALEHKETYLANSHEVATKVAKRELLYNKIDAFYWSIICYTLGFLLLCFSWLFAGKTLRWSSWGVVLTGFLIHTVGIFLRMLIRGRPAPVTTIYESIIFVGFICVLLGLIIEFRRRDGLGLLISTVPGIILHFVGFRYALEGDTMGRLVAVLDSNFWLATHVVSITIGYGAAAVAGLIANAYLFVRLFKPGKKNLMQSISKNFIGITLVALLFCIVGTILGGIWGDQSWGRFWGWDPKENGALLLCLWLLIVLHGKWGKQLKELGIATMLALVNIVVLLAWFGVNLLSVGLHSYGFTEGAAFNLAIACGAILVLTLIPSFTIYIRDNTSTSDPSPGQPSH